MREMKQNKKYQPEIDECVFLLKHLKAYSHEDPQVKAKNAESEQK